MTNVTDKQVKHTAGPWELRKKDGDLIINPLHPRRLIPLPPVCVIVDQSQRDEPNARLIAAAPELLEALKLLKASCIHTEGSVLDKVEAAIAKAEGRQL